MTEPTQLTATLTEFIERHEPGSRMRDLGVSLLRAHGTNQDRRAAVLKHPDLAKRAAQVLNLARPEHWTGFIPPAIAIDDDGGILRSVSLNRDGSQRVRFHQLGARSCGMVMNTGPERAVLLEISAEAWRREHDNPTITENIPT